MSNQEAAELQEKIMDFCRDLQKQHPDWFFARCFSEAQRQHPEWFTDGEATRDSIEVAQKEMQNQKKRIALGVAASADSEVDPKDIKELVALLDQQLQNQIKAAVAEIQKESPGLNYQDAYGLAKMRHPGLFITDSAIDEAEEVNPKHDLMPGDKRMGICQQLMENHPGTEFGQALQHLKRTRPDMFDVPRELADIRKAMSYA
jgi:hypothetical protein